MSILDLHEEATTAAAPRYSAPRAPEPKFSAWSFATAAPRGIAAAGAEVAATGLELAAGLRSDDFGVGGYRREAFQSDAADTVRAYAQRELRPDPATAHMAEEVLFGIARGASKIVAGALVAGPVGIVAAGAEEMNTVSADLKSKGIDPTTRDQAAAVQGAGLALAALPLVGTSLKATAALYLAGGPGGFMAQQALTRQILQGANYDRQAEQYDPFDPVGLLLSSIIPLPFAAWGVRGQRTAAKAAADEAFRTGPVPSERTAVAQAVDTMPREAVDAAMVQHTMDRSRQVDTAAMQFAATPRRIESLPEFLAREKIKPEPVPPEVTGDFIAWIRQMGGIDFAQKYEITGERSGVLSNPGGIFRRGGLGPDDLALQAEAAGYMRPGEGADSQRFVDMVQAAVRGDRVLTFEQQMAHAAREQQLVTTQARLEAVEQRLQLLGVDTAAAQGNVAALEAFAAKHEPAILAAALDEAAAARADGDWSPEAAALQDRALAIAQDVREGDRTLAQYEAEVLPLSPVMRRLVDQELKQEPVRAATAPEAANPEGSAPARSDAAPAPAAAVPEPRGTDDAQAAGVTPGAKAEDAAAVARLTEVQAQHPDLMVQIDGMDKPMRLAEFLAAVKAEADEMVADAPLMQVAAECAILNG